MLTVCVWHIIGHQRDTENVNKVKLMIPNTE